MTSSLAKNSPEHHLFILWEHARAQEARILDDISSHFEIVKMVEKCWGEDEFSSHLHRFYGPVLPPGRRKELHCGTGAFLVLVVRDNDPVYSERVTLRGLTTVNAKLFDAKNRYREWTGGGHRVHGTDNLVEANEHMALLFGCSGESFCASQPLTELTNYPRLNDPLIGFRQWDSPKQLFDFINAATPYVVLRNYIGLPEQYAQEKHGDIDILTHSAQRFCELVLGERLNKNPHSGMIAVRVAGENLYLDVRSYDDGYYDSKWSLKMLDSAVLRDGGVYTPNDLHHFYSLLYHALIHKRAIADDYMSAFAQLAEQAGLNPGAIELEPEALSAQLKVFMEMQGYEYVEPRDLSVYFNTEFLPEQRVSISRIFSSDLNDDQKVLQITRQACDVCSDSQELQEIGRAQVELLRSNFSPNRTHFLCVRPFNKNETVAVLGNQSSAVVRYLAENVREVLSYEGNAGRSAVVAERCRDLNNVRFFDSLRELSSQRTGYDCVVIEFDEFELSATPDVARFVGAYLGVARRLLKPGGTILGTIPNSQSVVAALSGEACPGITLAGLSQSLDAQGLQNKNMNYAFPQARCAYTLVRDTAFDDTSLSLVDWVSAGRYYDCENNRIDYSAVEKVVRKSEELGSIADVAGAFVFEASAGELPEYSDWLVCSVNAENRLLKAKTTTTLYVDAKTGFGVSKTGEPFVHGPFRLVPNHDYPYYVGTTLLERILKSARAGDLRTLMEDLSWYAGFLSEKYTVGAPTTCLPGFVDTMLEGCCFDLVPQNIIMTDDGPRVIDLEWQFCAPLPLSFVVYRTLVLLQQHLSETVWMKLFDLEGAAPDRHHLWPAIMNGLPGIEDVTGRTIQIYDQVQYRFFAMLHNKLEPEPSFAELYWQFKMFSSGGEIQKPQLQACLEQLRKLYAHIPEMRAAGHELGL